MSTKRTMIEGRDWSLTPVTVPSSCAQFLGHDYAQENPDEGT